MDLLSHERDWEKLIKLAYKSNYHKRKNQVIFLMINDNETNDCYYFAVKNLSEINSLGWLKGKKEAIINNDNSFQNALDEALNYWSIKTNPERISKLKPYINKYNWEGIKFPAWPKDWKNLKEIIRKFHLMYYIYHAIQKRSVLHIDQNITSSAKSKQFY